MARIGFFCLVALFLITSCRSKQPQHVQLKVTFPPILTDGANVTRDDSVNIFYYQNYVLYHLPVTVMEHNGDEVVRQKMVYDSFLFHQDSLSGYLFKHNASLNPPINLLVEPLLKDRGVKPELDSVDLRLIDRTVNANSINEKLVLTSVNHPDTAIFHYDANKRYLRYSLSPERDSLSKSKLHKVSFSHFSAIKNPPCEFSYEISEPVRKQRKNKEIVKEFKSLINAVENNRVLTTSSN